MVLYFILFILFYFVSFYFILSYLIVLICLGFVHFHMVRIYKNSHHEQHLSCCTQADANKLIICHMTLLKTCIKDQSDPCTTAGLPWTTCISLSMLALCQSRLLLGTEAPVMPPNIVDFSFCLPSARKNCSPGVYLSLPKHNMWLQAAASGRHQAPQPRRPLQVHRCRLRPASGVQLQRTPHHCGGLLHCGCGALVCMPAVVDHQAPGLPCRQADSHTAACRNYYMVHWFACTLW